jgi:predicted transcriptional regulator
MSIKVMTVGIISKEEYMRRTIAIAKGTYVPKKADPKIWFESLNSMSQVLSAENQELLRLIIEHKPHSLVELEELSARRKSNLSRTLKTLAKYGIVDLEKVKGKIVPKVKATDFKVEFGLNLSMPVPKHDNQIIA